MAATRAALWPYCVAGLLPRATIGVCFPGFDHVVGKDAGGDAAAVLALEGDEFFGAHVLVGEQLAAQRVGGVE